MNNNQLQLNDHTLDMEDARKKGIWSIVLAIMGLCCGVTAFVGLGLAISGLKRDRGNILCKVGLGLSAAVIVINIVSALYLNAHPELVNSYMGTPDGLSTVQ